jgi:hypothetical protein
MRAGSKELRELVRRFRPGYSLRSAGSINPKPYVIGPDGEPVRMEDGRPLRLPSTPSPRDVYTHERKLRRYGVID